MAIGIVSDDEFLREVDRLTSKGKVKTLERGRGTGNNEVPQCLRNLIAAEHHENGRSSAIELAEKFDISQSSESAYAAGATSTATYNIPNNEIVEVIDNTKERVSKVAQGKLLSALENITNDKLKDAKVKDLASIAKDMSAVVKNMEPENNENVAPVQFVVWAPKVHKEEHYKVIQVKE